MNKRNYAFGNTEINILKSFIGKQFDNFVSDNAFGGTKSFTNALFSISGSYYVFSNKLVALDYYGNGIEDVALFSLEKADSDIVQRERNFERAIETPIRQLIKNIDIVTETQKVFKSKEQQSETSLTRGIVFHLADGYEVSFEKDIWFSEAIRIQRGYNLIETFNPTSEFEKDWADGFSGVCERTITQI